MPRLLAVPVLVQCGRCGSAVVRLHALPLEGEEPRDVCELAWPEGSWGALRAYGQELVCMQCGSLGTLAAVVRDLVAAHLAQTLAPALEGDGGAHGV